MDTIKLRNAANFVRAQLQDELHPKLTKQLDYGKIILLQKLLNILT
jgi:hypothetical protein